MANEDEARDWNGATGRYWADHPGHYDAMLARLTPHLIEAAGIRPRERVLDIGCGFGTTTLLAAERGATVLGADLSGPMLAVARERAAGRDGVRFEQTDVQVHDFGADSFDVALSRFGVMFFDDPLAAFTNVTRALRPGGRLAFLCWQDLRENEHRAVALDAIAPHVDVTGAAPAGPGPFSFARPDYLRELLSGAGLTGIGVDPVREPVRLGADAADAAEFLRHGAMFKTIFARYPAETVERAVAALIEALVPHETPEGVLLGGATWLVTARKP
ncbi:class I SAM-dependent methyltransferase [Amycolatopsis thermophila]|uniref:SAM-dependent methyltransferase n=1 Tax=Amycolatopsis thermophila TaxID=206084 RepID=A0ABU0EZ83_9PSEU|nr:class I SAM-dependent methyltransferase [Amycolatopsis thermophila]MDQ0380625.1 SAM-dependent methyltransferase [Amycolatopsis thermophila]